MTKFYLKMVDKDQIKRGNSSVWYSDSGAELQGSSYQKK